MRTSHRLIALVGTAAAVVGLSACAGGSGGSAKPVDTAGVTAPILSTLSGDQKSQVTTLIAQAKSEGGLTWIDSVVAPTTAAAMMAEFQKEYNLPSTKLTFERLTSGELSSRLQQEVTAHKVKTDFFGVSSPRLFDELKSANALLNYTSPESGNYTAASKYVNENPGYWIAPDAYAFAVVVNPALYPKTVTSWKDLADPALKGKWDVPNVSANEGSLYWYQALRTKLDESVFSSWAANGPMTSTGSSVQEAQKVAQGHVAVSITAGFRVSQTVAQTKVPLKVYYPSEGTPLSPQTYAIPSNSPDPATAKLFDDFLLSKTGQQLYVAKEGIGSFYPGVDPSTADAAYQPAFADMPIIPQDTSKIAATDLDKARNEWKGLFSR